MLRREPLRADMVADEPRIAPVAPLHLSVRNAAAVWGVCEKTFRKRLDVEGGSIRTLREGNRLLVPLAEMRRVSREEIEKAAAQEKTPRDSGGVAKGNVEHPQTANLKVTR